MRRRAATFPPHFTQSVAAKAKEAQADAGAPLGKC